MKNITLNRLKPFKGDASGITKVVFSLRGSVKIVALYYKPDGSLDYIYCSQTKSKG